MKVVIIGGNECMISDYKNLCRKYNCKAKVFIEMNRSLRDGIGNPDLMILFTNTTSHKMVKCALCQHKACPKCIVERSHSSSINSLKEILDKHIYNT